MPEPHLDTGEGRRPALTVLHITLRHDEYPHKVIWLQQPLFLQRTGESFRTVTSNARLSTIALKLASSLSRATLALLVESPMYVSHESQSPRSLVCWVWYSVKSCLSPGRQLVFKRFILDERSSELRASRSPRSFRTLSASVARLDTVSVKDRSRSCRSSSIANWASDNSPELTLSMNGESRERTEFLVPRRGREGSGRRYACSDIVGSPPTCQKACAQRIRVPDVFPCGFAVTPRSKRRRFRSTMFGGFAWRTPHGMARSTWADDIA